MHRLISLSKRAIGTTTAIVLALIGQQAAFAASGTWTNPGSGTYSTASNWQSSTVANGATFAANFTSDIDGEADVTLDSSRTLGHLTFGDANTGTPGVWVVVDGGVGNLITLDNGANKPTITVNELGPVTIPDVGTFAEAFIDVGLAGTNGFTKLGNGVLTLDGNRNTISGAVNVDAGTLRLGSMPGGPPGFLYSTDGTTPTAQTITQFNVAHGATLENSEPTVLVANVAVNAGATATFRQQTATNGNGTINNLTAPGTGETINLEIANPSTLSLGGNITGFTTVNATGLGATQGIVRLMASPTGTGVTAFNINSFATSTLNLNNAQLTVRTNSGGNDINIGTLNGTANAQLAGGVTGSVARYHIGDSGNPSSFAGEVITGAGGILLEKVGGGTMTLSGNLTYTTTTNTNANLRGGVTRISAGTLALSANAAIPGGSVDGVLGDLYTTIDIRNAATYDVSGRISTASTANLQQIIGVGTVQGNYIHGTGRLRPGDVPQAANPNGNLTTPTVGTLTFDDNVSFAGTGEIVLDMAATPAGSSTEKIQVNGTTTLTGSNTKVTPFFLTTIPTTGTYPILTSTGGFVGSPTGWTVDWPGRGVAPVVTAAGNQLQFNAVPVTGDSVTWRGTGGAAWDVELTQNWHNNDTVAQDKYFNGDDVNFKDTFGPTNTAVTNFSVSMTGDLSPNSVTVESTNGYTLGGSGRIIGGATFAKKGNSTLVMQRPNAFSGTASIEAGTVNIGDFNGALGTGTLAMSGGTIVAANTTAVGLTNTAMTLAASTTSTVQANGDQADTLDLPAMSGDGNLVLTTTVANKLVGIGNTTGFTGDLTAGDGGGAGLTVRVSPAASLPNSVVTLNNGAVLANRAGGGTPGTVAIGALTGTAGTRLNGFIGGGALPETVWQIGGLNMTTEFAGVVANRDDNATISSLVKAGTATLTLSGSNTYTGNTSVQAGILSISNPYLANGADVLMTTGGVLNLNFIGTDVIDSLFFNGESQATGTWGRIGSSAAHQSAFFTGDGLLQISTFVPPPVLFGDYNSDDRVDAADYTVWRNNFGNPLETALNGNGDNMNGVDQGDYNLWKLHYGDVAPLGAGGGGLAVPEPTSGILVLLAFGCGCGWRRRRTR